MEFILIEKKCRLRGDMQRLDQDEGVQLGRFYPTEISLDDAEDDSSLAYLMIVDKRLAFQSRYAAAQIEETEAVDEMIARLGRGRESSALDLEGQQVLVAMVVEVEADKKSAGLGHALADQDPRHDR